MRSLSFKPVPVPWRLALAAAVAFGAGAPARAGDALFTDAAGFAAAAGATVTESFESLAARSRTVAALVTSGFTVTPDLAGLGVQTGPNSPDTGYGSAATDGTHYLSVYRPGQVVQGAVRFTLNAPTTAFGFYLIDAGETDGQVRLTTGNGAYAAGATLLTFPPTLADGNVRFIGLTQSQAFTSVVLDVTGVDEAYGIDQVVRSAVPETGSAALLAGGAVLLTVARRRQRTGRPAGSV